MVPDIQEFHKLFQLDLGRSKEHVSKLLLYELRLLKYYVKNEVLFDKMKIS